MTGVQTCALPISRIIDSEGQIISKPVRVGDIVWVEVKVETTANIKNIVLETLIPSGFEAENARLVNIDHVFRNLSGSEIINKIKYSKEDYDYDKEDAEDGDNIEDSDTKEQKIRIVKINSQYTDIKDDRVEQFFDVWANTSSYLYIPLRAICPGNFKFPQTRAFCMYDPEIKAYSSSSEITVKH